MTDNVQDSQMNDTALPATPVEDSATTIPPPTTSTQPQPSSATTKSTRLRKPRRARPRRRGAADSESDGDAEADHAASDDSLTADESSSTSDEADEDAVEAAVEPSPAKSSRATSTFADVSSIIPVAWAGEKDNAAPVEEIGFDDFNTGGSRGGGTIRGRGRGRGGVNGESTKRVFTEEEQKKFAEKKAKMKERQKAKKKEVAEAKRKEREAAAATPKGGEAEPAGPAANTIPAVSSKSAEKAKKKQDEKRTSDPVDSIVASTSTSSVNDAAPSPSIQASNGPNTPQPPLPPPDNDLTPNRRGPSSNSRGKSRDSFPQRNKSDVQSTPRAGGFWAHDQRSRDEGYTGDGDAFGLRQNGEHRRGRGGPRGAFRGDFRGRGRGRGGFPPLAQHNINRGRELTEERELDGKKTLEMDKVEAELEAREKERELVKEAEAEAAKQDVDEDGWPKEEADSHEATVRPIQVKEHKWGHEGFESMRTVETFQANRMERGRGRGRGRGGGRGFPGRGVPFAPHGPMHNVPRSGPVVNIPPPASQQVVGDASTTRGNAAGTTETLFTQTGTESLLAGASEAVTVKLPGLDKSVDSDTAPADPPKPSQASMPSANGQAEMTSASEVAAPPAPSPAFPTLTSAVSTSAGAGPSRPLSHRAPVFAQPVPISGSPAACMNGMVYQDGSVASPQPFLTLAGSENGSISSNGQFAPPALPTPNYLPQGISMTPDGAYYNVVSGASVEFRPVVNQPQANGRTFYPSHVRSFPAQQQQSFYPPQSYSPDPYQNGQQYAQRSSLGSQSAMFFPEGRNSPFNPYAMPNGFFTPARPGQKVSIRAPVTGEDTSMANGTDDTKATYASVNGGEYYSQHYNPYAASGMAHTGQEGYHGMHGPNRMGNVYWSGQEGYGEADIGYGYGDYSYGP